MDTDRERFEAIFRRHYGEVVRYAVRRVGREGADEVVAETFLVVWRHLDRVPANATPWLFATARKVVANELRRRDRQVRVAARVASRAGAGIGDRSGSSDGDLSDVIDESLRIRAALSALSERDQEVLRLSAWEDLSVRDAAQSLGCSPAAYKVRLHRARRRLADYLGSPADSLEHIVPEGEQA